ncbi:MAG: hypothetical protein ACJAQT_000532 [Akkermansiaceae bacterium]|jgi:hypothetical protein
MEPTFLKQLPGSNTQTRDDLFKGKKFIAPANDSSLALVKSVQQLIASKLGVTDIRKAHLEMSDSVFFEKMGELRRIFYLEARYHDQLRDLLASHDFDPDRCAFDPLRIRVILPGGHHNPKAAPVYYAHRDTWYAHPQSLIVGWIPLHDLAEEETFEFYPDYFNKPVPNDSEIFNYAEWIKDGPALKIGWQNKDSGLTADYPRSLLETPPTRAHGFAIRKGQTLLFSGSQFHQTREQDLGTIRYSLDFRVVDLDDIAGNRGAPNVDNRSRGNILADYIQPES